MDDSFERPRFDGIQYQNPTSFTSWVDPPSLGSFSSWSNFFRWRREPNLSNIPNDEELARTLPVQRPNFPLESQLGATWLGHATVFVHIDGISLITDPVWASTASPFSRYFCRRYRPPPCTVAELPEIRIAFISHNHYDHLDRNCVKLLSQRFPKLEWFVPQGLGEWMRRETQNGTVHELTWGEHLTLALDEGKFEIWSIPAQHWSQRTICDRNKSLWSGWLVKGPNRKFFYTGDTGFCEQEFRKLGERHGPIDLSALPIGCYSPRWFMRPQHIDAREAVRIHQLAKSQKSLAIHWGTYSMGSAEPYLEPKTKLREALQTMGLRTDEFITLEHGESWRLEEEKGKASSRWKLANE